MELLGFDLPLWWLLSGLALYALYKYSTQNFNFFQDQGISGPTPWPLVGNVLQTFAMSGQLEADLENRRKYGKTYGTFNGNQPYLVTSDVDLMRQIMVKEFSHFTNRRRFKGGIEKPLDKMMTILEDDEWRKVRNTVSPSFSGGKLRRMKNQMNRCSKTLADNLKARAGEPFHAKDMMGAYAMDVIASTAFGLDVDSQTDPNNPFVRHAKKAFVMNSVRPILIVVLLFPALGKILQRYFGISFFPKETSEFFTDIVNQGLASRTKADKNIRTDFLQLMVNAHEETGEDYDDNDVKPIDEGKVYVSKKGLTHDEILSQGFIFFAAGYNTVSDCLTFTLYELALNPDVQTRMYEEILDVVGDKEPDYETLNKLHYTEMVIQESLRMYPPALRLERIAADDCEINGIKFEKDMLVGVSVTAVHNEPAAWPEPKKFDPERFTPEKKAERDPFYWQPFGMGPRNCIGMRLALMELKMALVYMIKNFEIKTCEKTNIPVKRNKVSGQPVDVFLAAQPRS